MLMMLKSLKKTPKKIDIHAGIVLLFIRSRDEECVDLRVLVMSDLDDELWDSQSNMVE